MRRLTWTWMCVVILACAGCGDDDGTDVVDDGGSSGSDLGTSPGVDGGPTPDVDGGPMTDPDGGPMTDTDGGPTMDTDGGTGSGTVACGDMTCDAATQQCCVSGGGGGATATCIGLGEECMGATADCDGPEDCSGAEICCAMVEGLGGAASCTTDDCSGFTSFELCHSPTDCTDGSDMCCEFSMGGLSASVCRPMCGFGP